MYSRRSLLFALRRLIALSRSARGVKVNCVKHRPQEAGSHISRFAVVFPFIDIELGHRELELLRPPERDAVLADVLGIFRCVELDLHTLIVYTAGISGEL